MRSRRYNQIASGPIGKFTADRVNVDRTSGLVSSFTPGRTALGSVPGSGDEHEHDTKLYTEYQSDFRTETGVVQHDENEVQRSREGLSAACLQVRTGGQSSRLSLARTAMSTPGRQSHRLHARRLRVSSDK